MQPRSHRFTNLLPLVLVLVTLFAVACGEVELYQDLSEEDANEIMVLLSDNNIKATKKKELRQNEISYSVLVPSNNMSKARSLLVRHHLPRHKELGLTGVYKEKGLIPTPDEQKARYLLAVKGEIINSLERLPEVVDVDVVLNVPTKDEFATDAKERPRPTASVVVRVKPGLTKEDAVTEAKIQQFVANAVEGMNPRDVAVIINYLSREDSTMRPGDIVTLPPKGVVPLPEVHGEKVDQQLLGLNLDEASKGRLKIYLLFFFILLILLSSVLIVAIIQGSRMRRSLQALQGPVGGRPAIEGKVIEEQRQLGDGEPPLGP